MQKILYGVAPPPDLIHYPLYTIFDRKGAPFIYLPLNKGLFIYFSSRITYPLISLRPENGRSVLLSRRASPYRPLHGVPPPHFRVSDQRLYCWDQHLQPVNGALLQIMCIYSNHCAPFFPRLYTTNPRHRNSVSESGTATTSQFLFVQTRDKINNNIPSIYFSYLLQLYRISV